MKRPGCLVTVQPTGATVITRREEPPSLDDLQKAVGGYIERVRVRYEGRVRDAYVNEEGLLKSLPPNRAATGLLAPPFSPGSFIVGLLVFWVPDPKETREQLAGRLYQEPARKPRKR